MSDAGVVPARSRIRRRRTAYILLRLSGVMLSVLVLGHFAATHVTTDVADTNSQFIDGRWATAFWIAWDGIMLVAVLAHVALGMWSVTADYSTGAARRRYRTAMSALVAFLLVYGLWVLAAGAHII
ncbi:hypothetical protein [Saccharopolyspora sp. NPDC049357]|uniref:hypothetical protein n=1 Tax=Saccharopolyspora sp. NPDC049357 TaxID=3154507 RepID=UPI00341F9C49